MSELHSDLIALDGDPLVLAGRYDAQAQRQLLGRLAETAARIGEGERFAEAGLLGCLGSGGRDVGISLHAGPLAGIGFWRDHLIRTEYAEREDMPLVTRAEATRRAREAQLLRSIFDARGEQPLPLALRLDVSSYMPVPFAEALRRRIAYALAYEATLTARSLAPFTSLHAAAVAGSVNDLTRACPDVRQQTCFSIALNLVDLVNGLVAYAAYHGATPPEHPTPVRDAEAKRTLLWARVEQGAAARIANLGKDTAIAADALIAAAREAESRQALFVARPALWGAEPDSARYRTPEDDVTIPEPQS